MARQHLKNILLKEWRLLFTDANGALTVLLLPFLIVGQGMVYAWLAVNFGGEAILGNPVFAMALDKLANVMPAIASLPRIDQLRVLLMSQFNFYVLLIPTVIAMSVATFSIVDEKVTGSLEALLATPVKTWELLLGKALAGALPALVMTWISSGVFLLAVTRLGWGDLTRFVVTPVWFLSLFLLTPAVALLSFMLGVIGSSRARDTRSAQTLSLVIVLPVIGLIAVQVAGLVWFTPWSTLALGLAMAAVDAGVLRAAVRLFQRESIIIRWR